MKCNQILNLSFETCYCQIMTEKRELPDKCESISPKKVKSSYDSDHLSRDVPEYLKTEYLEQSFDDTQINCADGKIKVKGSENL